MKAVIASVEANILKYVSDDYLSKLWYISEPPEEGAIDQKTQGCRHIAKNVFLHQFLKNYRMLRYSRIQSTFYTDTIFTLKYKSTPGNTSCEVFVSDKGFVAIYPM